MALRITTWNGQWLRFYGRMSAEFDHSKRDTQPIPVSAMAEQEKLRGDVRYLRSRYCDLPRDQDPAEGPER